MTQNERSNLQHDVIAELEWDPSIDASRIGVAVEDGVVTLTGHVSSYAEKAAADRVVKRVHGVEGVANDIEVQLPTGDRRDDAEIARTAVEALRWNAAVPEGNIKVSVSKGWITLDGSVDWQYQKGVAEQIVRSLIGVRGVTNDIAVLPKIEAADVKSKIEAALHRSAELDARKIKVETHGDEVILHGTVRSWIEREDAVHAAWSAPGVKKVVDELAIRVA